MVKNKKGGNKGKKGARKHLKNYGNKRKLRVVEDDAEIYAVVIKTFGHGMVDVMCNDGIIRLCHIRKKFSGRNKRDNMVNLNTLVMVGLRDWEVTDKKPKCDLLYVYDNNQLPELKKKVKFNEKLINSMTSNKSDLIDDEEDIGFDMEIGSDNELENMKVEDGDGNGDCGVLESKEEDGKTENVFDYYGTNDKTNQTKNNDNSSSKDDTWEDEWADI